MASIFSFVVLLGLFLRGDGYSSGAPSRTCGTMMPDHSRYGRDILPQTRPPPYRVTIEGDERTTAYTPGQEVTVKIKAHSAANQFRGFFLQAMTVNSARGSTPVGEWETVTSGTKTVCPGFRGTQAVTQRYARSRDEIVARWTVPESVGDVLFVATVVERFDRFWINITSPILQDGTVTPSPASPYNVTSGCSEDGLVALGAARPGVAILCYEDAHCPCGWVCCRQCQSTLAICRQPKESDAEEPLVISPA